MSIVRLDRQCRPQAAHDLLEGAGPHAGERVQSPSAAGGEKKEKGSLAIYFSNPDPLKPSA
jgi:hypothetical protein